jgi:hypothetical protein
MQLSVSPNPTDLSSATPATTSGAIADVLAQIGGGSLTAEGSSGGAGKGGFADIFAGVDTKVAATPVVDSAISLFAASNMPVTGEPLASVIGESDTSREIVRPWLPFVQADNPANETMRAVMNVSPEASPLPPTPDSAVPLPHEAPPAGPVGKANPVSSRAAARANWAETNFRRRPDSRAPRPETLAETVAPAPLAELFLAGMPAVVVASEEPEEFPETSSDPGENELANLSDGDRPAGGDLAVPATQSFAFASESPAATDGVSNRDGDRSFESAAVRRAAIVGGERLQSPAESLMLPPDFSRASKPQSESLARPLPDEPDTAVADLPTMPVEHGPASLPTNDQVAPPQISQPGVTAPAFANAEVESSVAKSAMLAVGTNSRTLETPRATSVPIDPLVESISPTPRVESSTVTIATSLVNAHAIAENPRPSSPAEMLDPRAANFAAENSNAASNDKLACPALDKIPLSVREEEVAEEVAPLGTRIAKNISAMSSAPSPHREILNASALSHAWMAPVESSLATISTESVPEAVKSAQHAVDAVLSLAEKFASTDRHTVNLQFSIGGADLQVKVELRRDEVHTAFHTESPELRSALAHEWQAMNGAHSDRAIRFTDPVFSASSRDDENSARFTHDSASQQQHREPAPQRENGQRPGSFSRGRPPVTPSVQVATPQPSSPSGGNTRRLHTFA